MDLEININNIAPDTVTGVESIAVEPGHDGVDDGVELAFQGVVAGHPGGVGAGVHLGAALVAPGFIVEDHGLDGEEYL